MLIVVNFFACNVINKINDQYNLFSLGLSVLLCLGFESGIQITYSKEDETVTFAFPEDLKVGGTLTQCCALNEDVYARVWLCNCHNKEST